MPHGGYTEDDMTSMTLRAELEHVLNRHAQENGSSTPDFILSKYLLACLEAFNEATNNRAQWYGHAYSEEGTDISVNIAVTSVTT